MNHSTAQSFYYYYSNILWINKTMSLIHYQILLKKFIIKLKSTNENTKNKIKNNNRISVSESGFVARNGTDRAITEERERERELTVKPNAIKTFFIYPFDLLNVVTGHPLFKKPSFWSLLCRHYYVIEIIFLIFWQTWAIIR